MINKNMTADSLDCKLKTKEVIASNRATTLLLRPFFELRNCKENRQVSIPLKVTYRSALLCISETTESFTGKRPHKRAIIIALRCFEVSLTIKMKTKTTFKP